MSTEFMNTEQISYFTYGPDQEQYPNQDQVPTRPLLLRRPHINEDIGLAEPIDFAAFLDQEENQEEEDQEEEQDEDAKNQLQAHNMEQDQDDLVWSEFGHRWVTQKDFDTFEPQVEPIIPKPVAAKPGNLFEKILLKYRQKANKINEIMEKQEKERQERQEDDDFCESDHEDLRDQEQEDPTFYDFADLADCFEEIVDNKEIVQSIKQFIATDDATTAPPKKLKQQPKCYKLDTIDLY